MPPPPSPPLYTTKALLRATTALTERAGPLRAPGLAAALSPLPGPPLPPAAGSRRSPAEGVRSNAARPRERARDSAGLAPECRWAAGRPRHLPESRAGECGEEGESVRTVAAEAVRSASARCLVQDSIVAAGGVNRLLHFVPGPLLLPDLGPRTSAFPPSSFAGLCAYWKKPFAA